MSVIVLNVYLVVTLSGLCCIKSQYNTNKKFIDSSATIISSQQFTVIHEKKQSLKSTQKVRANSCWCYVSKIWRKLPTFREFLPCYTNTAEMGIGFGVQIGAPVEPGDSEQTQSSRHVWLGQQAAGVELGWYSKHGCSSPPAAAAAVLKVSDRNASKTERYQGWADSWPFLGMGCNKTGCAVWSKLGRGDVVFKLHLNVESH